MNKQLSTMIITTLLLLVCAAAGLAQPLDGRNLELLFKKKMGVHYHSIHPLGDQNGDGYDDFVLINCPEENMYGYPEVYFGGNPMDTIPDVRWGTKYNQIGVADCNNDGHTDILLPNDSWFSVYLGGYQLDTLADQSVPHPLGRTTNTMYFLPRSNGDFNGDGYNDLLIFDYNYPYERTTFGMLFLYTTNTQGVVLPPVDSLTFYGGRYVIYAPQVYLTSGDINNDGFSDLSFFCIQRTEKGGFTENQFRDFHFGGPDFRFSHPVRYRKGNITFSARYTYIIPDMNGDGYDDILTADPYEIHYPWWYNFMLMNGGEVLDTIPDYGVNCARSYINAVIPIGDFNGDGYNDLTVDLSATGLTWMWFGGKPEYYNPRIVFYDFKYNDLFGNSSGAVGDVNGDGCDDFLVGTAATHTAPKPSDFYIFGGSSELTSIKGELEKDDDRQPVVPDEFSVFGAYPNPFNGTTKFRVSLHEAGTLKYTIYDSGGSEIISIENSANAGKHDIEFNAEHYNLASGIYFVRFEFITNTKQYSDTVKMQYLK